MTNALHTSGHRAAMAAAAFFAVCGNAAAAPAASAQDPSLLHAAALFATVWFIASLRLAKIDGQWRLGFEPSPIRGLASRELPK